MLLDIGLRCFDVDPVRVVVAAGDVADTDDLRAGFLEEEGVVGPDVAEALYDDGGVFRIDVLRLEQLEHAGRNAESGCRRAAL